MSLALLPTPLESAPRLSEAWGGPNIWFKRDDLSGFGLSGNKVRKLEFHVAAAHTAGATTLITCGAEQSNHCRSTAIVAARIGLRCVLLLRTGDGRAPASATGNHLLQRLAGAEVRFITPDQYRDRDALMEDVRVELAAAGETAWVIPEGASDHLGLLAFDHAFAELAGQVDKQIGAPVTIWHASSSAGTTAGLARGAEHSRQTGGIDASIVAVSVGDSAAYLSKRIRTLLAEPSADGFDATGAMFEVIDSYIGLGYGQTTDEELAVQVEGTRLTGMLWDPTYTGKSLYALKREIDRGRFESDDHVVFWHTGGGFSVFAHDFSNVLD